MVLLSTQDPFHPSFGNPQSFPSGNHISSNLRASESQRKSPIGSRKYTADSDLANEHIRFPWPQWRGMDRISPIEVNPGSSATDNGDSFPLGLELWGCMCGDSATTQNRAAWEWRPKKRVKEPRYKKKDQVLLTFIEPLDQTVPEDFILGFFFFSVTLTNRIFLLLFFF